MSCKIITLGEIIDLQNGYAFKSSEYTDSGYSLMRITNVQQGFIRNKNPKYVTIPHASKLKKFILNEGDILMSLTGDVGRVGEIKDTNLPAVLNQRVARVIIKSNLKIDKNYLFNLLNSDNLRHQIESKGHGAAQLNVSTNDILSIKISLPPLQIQQEIVKKLDAIFAEIDKATAAVKANLKNAETLFQSFLNKILKDDDNFIQVKLLEVCENITDGSHFSPKTLDDGYPYITVRDLDEEGINFNSCRFISKVDFQKFSKNGCSPKLNDLLFSKDGTVGKVALVNKETEFVVLSSLAILTPNLKIINPFFLYYVLKSPNFLNQAIKKKTGVAIRRIILKNLKEIEILLPPLPVQQKLIDKIKIINAEVSKLIQAHYKKSNQLELLKNSILKKAFNGELVKAA
jgi:type I restriction enzyme S subunit